MSEELKLFILGVSSSQRLGAMNWYGSVPEEVFELFQLNPHDNKQHLNIMGVKITVKPRFEPIEWKSKSL